MPLVNNQPNHDVLSLQAQLCRPGRAIDCLVAAIADVPAILLQLRQAALCITAGTGLAAGSRDPADPLAQPADRQGPAGDMRQQGIRVPGGITVRLGVHQ